jgi:hypothetical protein
MRLKTGFYFLTLLLLLLHSCKQEDKPIGDLPWPLDIRQNLPIRPALTCDTVHFKSISFEITHEQSLDTSLYALVITTRWPLYNGDFQKYFVVDSIPYCKDELERLPLICYLVDKGTKVSYQFQAKLNYHLLDSSLRKIRIQLFAEVIEDSGSNMKVSLNDGNWLY